MENICNRKLKGQKESVEREKKEDKLYKSLILLFALSDLVCCCVVCWLQN